MPDTTVRVEYIGAVQNFSEVTITGNQQVWRIGSSAFVETGRASQLVASGKFRSLANDPAMLPANQAKVGASSSGSWVKTTIPVPFAQNPYEGNPAVPTIPGAVHGWWSGPVVFRQTNEYGDNSFIGAADQYGHLVTLLYDHKTNSIRRKSIAKWEPDDHNVPAFVQRIDKRILVAYARHALENNIRYRISDTANCDDWGPEQTLATSGTATYVQMFRQSSAIHLFYRVGASGSGGWCHRRSTDNGATWSAERIILDTEYVLFVPTADATAFRAYCCQNPTSGTDHDIYYCTINSATGEIRANGAQVTGAANAFTGVGCPVAVSSIHKAVDVASATISTRLMSASVAQSQFSCLAVEFTSASTTDGKLYRYSYSANNVVFTRRYICDVGVPFSTATQYHGGAWFDPASQDTVYVARNDGAGVWSVEKYVTTDAGVTWASTVLYSGAKKLARPMPFGDNDLLFSEFDAYISYEDFTNGVLRIVSRSAAV